MVTTALFICAALVLTAGIFIGALLGYRAGFRDGQRVTRMSTNDHWVELLETSLNTRDRAARAGRVPAGQVPADDI